MLTITPGMLCCRANDPVLSQPMPAAERLTERPAERPPETEEPMEEWKPFSDPEAALRAAQKRLENDDWWVGF